MNKWQEDKKTLQYIKKLRKVNVPWEIISQKIKTNFPEYEFPTPETLRKTYSNHRNEIEEPEQNDGVLSYDEAYKELCSYINKTREIVPAKSKNKTKTEKILVISDLHIPFHNEIALKKIVNEHKDADKLYIVGDYLDCYSVSRFSKRQDIPLKEELSKATAITDWLASIFPEVIITDGNHSDRVRKYFESRVNVSVMFLVQYDVLSLIIKNLPNVKIVKDCYTFPNGKGDGEIGHFVLIGRDCVVGHFEKSSVIPVKAAHDAYKWINSWKSVFGINKISLFLQAHTHRFSKYPVDNGETTIGETGSVCQIQEYMLEPKARYNPILNGYYLVYQTNGITDINKSNFYMV